MLTSHNRRNAVNALISNMKTTLTVSDRGVVTLPAKLGRRWDWTLTATVADDCEVCSCGRPSRCHRLYSDSESAVR